MTPHEKLKSSASTIRGLINYHKRMMCCSEKCVSLDPITGEMQKCNTCSGDECPKVTFANDVYLNALETALGLIEREIAKTVTD